ncbi:MAG: hypothetical protein J6I85_04635 [Clostridia bacterium]|nr:hypothetical protein [Clostridia bacterium]
MIRYSNEDTNKKIEQYLNDYTKLDDKINILKSIIQDEEYNQNYARYIKHRSSSLEDLVIRNMELEQKILKIRKWKSLITIVFNNYKFRNELFYKFLNLKYIEKVDPSYIQEKLNLSSQQQKDIERKILRYILLLAIKNKMLREVN